jgi:hypothetical protein
MPSVVRLRGWTDTSDEQKLAAQQWKWRAEARKLPRVASVATQAVMDMLMTDQGMTRPPEKAAALLALITELDNAGLAFPERAVIAAALDCSVYTVDAALSTRTEEGYISLQYKTVPGNVARRHSVIKERYYVPSKRLRAVVESAKKRA